MIDRDERNWIRGLLPLSIIWLVGAVGDRIWFALDHSVPAWDQADYLTGSLNYWRALQQPQWLDGEWWTSFWLLSSKIPPLTYIATAVVQHVFGTGPDQATLVNLLFSAILLSSIYGLGVELFSVEVGLWAAGLCQLLPGLYQFRLDFLLDYPLAAVVALSFWCLTVWRSIEVVKTQRTGWLWAAAFGLSFGLALMVKQTALFFLLTPVLWMGVGAICRRNWGRVFQLLGGLLLSVVVFGPWYRTNWLLVLTAGKRATVDSAIAEGDPALNTLAAWTYYWNQLPHQISWPLLLVPIVGLLLYGGLRRWSVITPSTKTDKNPPHSPLPTPHSPLPIPHSPFPIPHSPFPIPHSPFPIPHSPFPIPHSPFPTPHSPLPIPHSPLPTPHSLTKSLFWLAIFWVGAYLLCSLNINKDPRYVLPYLPVLAVFLAYSLTFWRGRVSNIRACTVGLAVLLMFFNLFPVGGTLGNAIAHFNPKAQHHAELKPEWPHRQVIDEMIRTDPYLRSTLGVLPSTAKINQHNFNYYGALKDFQVYGRQVGTREKQVSQDARSLWWFLTKTGNQGLVPKAQAAMVEAVERSPDFQLHKTWNLPNGNTLNLYHRTPPIQVQPSGQEPGVRVALSRVTVPEQAPPGVPLPVIYEWSGTWEQLQSGTVLLTWRSSTQGRLGWLHDHGIGMGALYPISMKTGENKQVSGKFQAIEQMAMLPPADVPTGIYTLEATYLNRHGKSYPISVPPVMLKINPEAAAIPAPELDLVTQLRTLGAALPKGPDALGPVFEEIGRINQYDPIQDYLVQTRLTLEHRLQMEPRNRDWVYTLALTEVLARRVKDAITALERVTQLDSQNPYAYAYLAFVHLYDWNPKAAEAALKPAVILNPSSPEIEALSGIAALMQGNLIKAWHYAQPFIAPSPS